jgi:AraC-like DNA-binding protein
MAKTSIQKFDFRLSPRKPFDVMYTGTTGVSAVPTQLDMHKAIHFGLLLAGRLKSVTRGRTYSLSPGDCYLIAPWEPHGVMWREDSSILLLSISGEELARNFLDAGDNLRNLLQTDPDRRTALLNASEMRLFVQEFRRDFEALEAEPSPNRTRQWHRITGFFIDLDARLTLPGEPPPYQRLDKALELIHQRNGEPVSLEEAATSCSLGKSRFRHLFKDYFGISFGSYELQYRLSGAAESLSYRNLPLKEIAEQWGFFDAAHFSRYFRKYYGVSPGHYQKSFSKQR